MNKLPLNVSEKDLQQKKDLLALLVHVLCVQCVQYCTVLQ